MNYQKFFNDYFLIKPYPVSSLFLEKKFLSFSVQNYFKILNIIDNNFINNLAEKRAISVFKLTAKYVPAYKDFLKKAKINPDKIITIQDFKQVPIIDKKN